METQIQNRGNVSTLVIKANDCDKPEVIKAINKHRLANKNRWYQFEVSIFGKTYKAKAFGTWLQIFTDGKYNYSGLMDISATAYKEHLFQSIHG